MTRRMAQDELSTLKQSARLALFHLNQTISTRCPNQRLARDAVGQAALDSSDRFETTLTLELRESQFNNESTIQQRERDILFRLGDGSQDALRQQRTHTVHEQNQLVQEGEAQIDFCLRQMESQQRATLRNLKTSVTRS